MGCETEVFNNAPWFIPLLIGALVLAIISKSLVANIGLLVLAAVGVFMARTMDDVPSLVQYGLLAMFITLIAFSVTQMIWKVERV